MSTSTNQAAVAATEVSVTTTQAPQTAKAKTPAPKQNVAKTTRLKKAAANSAGAAAPKDVVASANAQAKVDPRATPKTIPDRSKITDESFENREADNPLASRGVKKSLKDQILELAEKNGKKYGFTPEKDPAPKKSAVVKTSDDRSGEDLRDATAVASPKVKKQTQEEPLEQESEEIVDAEGSEEPAIEQEQPESEFEELNGTADGEIETQEETETPEWEPDFKFKAQKFLPTGDPENPFTRAQVDLEIPEKFRSLITDAESEAEIKGIFQKSEGFDFVQQRRDQYRAEKEHLDTALGTVRERLTGVDDMIRSGDLDSAFQTMQIPEEKVLQWVLDKINYSQLDPAQRQLIDGRRESERRAKQLEMDNKSIKQQNSKLIGTHKAMELDAVLSRPDLKPLIEAYDSRPGKKPQDLSFKDLVINHGEIHWQRSGGKVDLPSLDAVEAVLRIVGMAQSQGQAPAANQRSATPQPNAARTAQPRQATAPQTLPSVQGRAASPTAPRITNKKQLMQFRKTNYGF